MVFVALLEQRSFTQSGGVVVGPWSHDDPASFDEDLLALLLDRVSVLGDIGVVALGHILLSTLVLLLLLHGLSLLLPDHTQYSISFFNSTREVNRGVLNRRKNNQVKGCGMVRDRQCFWIIENVYVIKHLSQLFQPFL